MTVKRLFLNRHGELRYGWRILLFLVLLTLGLLATAPATRLLTDDPLAGRALALLGACLATWLVVRFVNRKPFSAIGLSFHPAWVREIGAGAGLGFLMIAGVFAVEFLLGFVALSSRGISVGAALGLLGSSVVLMTLNAAFEELLFRGYLFQTLIQWVTFLPATLIMALLFGLAHVANPGATAFSTFNVALAGIWLSVAYMKTRSLWLPIALHASWNWFESIVFSFPVSGLRMENRSLFTLTQQGPPSITGGAFGPEGGVLATVALIVCTGVILKSGMLRAPEGIITLDSIEDLVDPGQRAAKARR